MIHITIFGYLNKFSWPLGLLKSIIISILLSIGIVKLYMSCEITHTVLTVKNRYLK